MKESTLVRFTRSGQAGHFVLIGMIFFCLSLGLFVLSVWPQYKEFIRPVLNSKLWSLIPLPLTLGCWWKAYRLSRDPYLVWSPIGLEIYPFLQADTQSQLIPWAQIGKLEIFPDSSHLKIDFAHEEQSGVIVTLRPLSRSRRLLLEHMVQALARQLVEQRPAPITQDD
jgi:hypothetical protein